MSTRVSDHPHHQQTFHVRLLRLAYPEATNIEAAPRAASNRTRTGGRRGGGGTIGRVARSASRKSAERRGKGLRDDAGRAVCEFGGSSQPKGNKFFSCCRGCARNSRRKSSFQRPWSSHPRLLAHSGARLRSFSGGDDGHACHGMLRPSGCPLHCLQPAWRGPQFCLRRAALLLASGHIETPTKYGRDGSGSVRWVGEGPAPA